MLITLKVKSYWGAKVVPTSRRAINVWFLAELIQFYATRNTDADTTFRFKITVPVRENKLSVACRTPPVRSDNPRTFTLLQSWRKMMLANANNIILGPKYQVCYDVSVLKRVFEMWTYVVILFILNCPARWLRMIHYPHSFEIWA